MKGQMEEDLHGEAATHFQTQESPTPTLSTPDASEKGSRWWHCRVNSVGAGQLAQPRSAYGRKPSTVLCAGSPGAHSQQQLRGLPIVHCASDSYRL